MAKIRHSDITATDCHAPRVDGTSIKLISDSPNADKAAIDFTNLRTNHFINPTVAGTANAITLTFDPPFTSLVEGTIIRFKAISNNTGSVTINCDTLGAVSLKKSLSSELVLGDISANQYVEALYDGTYWIALTGIGVFGNAFRKSYVYDDIMYNDGYQNAPPVNSPILKFIAPLAGYLTTSTYILDTQLATGTLAIQVYLNGVALATTGLNFTVTSSSATTAKNVVSYGTTGYSISAGDVVEIRISNNTSTPKVNRFRVSLIMEALV